MVNWQKLKRVRLTTQGKIFFGSLAVVTVMVMIVAHWVSIGQENKAFAEELSTYEYVKVSLNDIEILEDENGREFVSIDSKLYPIEIYRQVTDGEFAHISYSEGEKGIFYVTLNSYNDPYENITK